MTQVIAMQNCLDNALLRRLQKSRERSGAHQFLFSMRVCDTQNRTPLIRKERE
jgi:hypothetical protein